MLELFGCTIQINYLKIAWLTYFTINWLHFVCVTKKIAELTAEKLQLYLSKKGHNANGSTFVCLLSKPADQININQGQITGIKYLWNALLPYQLSWDLVSHHQHLLMIEIHIYHPCCGGTRAWNLKLHLVIMKNKHVTVTSCFIKSLRNP